MDEDLDSRLARIEAQLAATNQLIVAVLGGGTAATGGAGGAAGPGGAAGGGGGALGGGGGAGGSIGVSNVVVGIPPAELLAWLRPLAGDIADDIESDQIERRLSGWRRLGAWLVGEAIALPPAVAANLIAAAIA